MELLKWSLAPWASGARVFSLAVGMGAEDAVALCAHHCSAVCFSAV